jgi:hypothetical protein
MIHGSLINNADLTGADFSSAKLGWYISGPQSTIFTISNSIAKKIIFSGVEFGVEQTYCCPNSDVPVQTVIFTNSDFTGAIFDPDAKVDNVKWENCICPDGTKSSDNGNTCKNNFLPPPLSDGPPFPVNCSEFIPGAKCSGDAGKSYHTLLLTATKSECKNACQKFGSLGCCKYNSGASVPQCQYMKGTGTSGNVPGRADQTAWCDNM